MKRLLFFGNLFWLLFSLITCIEAYRLRLGEIQKPGPGFFPFSVGLVMVGLSLAALFQSVGKKNDIQKAVRQEPLRWKRIVIILAAIVAYSLSIETIGFLINTFLFVCLMLKVVEPQTWKKTILGGLVTAVAANLVFNVIFRSQIPSGILGF